MTKYLYKRIYAVLLVVVVLLAVVPSPAAAASGQCGANVRWELTAGVLNISGEGRMESYSPESPAPWSGSAEQIVRIVVGEGVTSVGSYAFCELPNLSSVRLSSTVEQLSDRAFCNCPTLPTVIFPAALRVIGTAAFEGCSALNNIRFPASLNTIRDYAFYRCEALTSVTVPESVYFLGKVVFAYCKSLTHASILCQLEQLPDSTFYACEALVSVQLPSSMSAVGEHIFYDCGNLGSIYFQGENPEALMRQISASDSNISPYLTVHDAPFSGESNTITDSGDNSSVYVSTTTSDSATVTVRQEQEYAFTVDGKEVTVEEAVRNPDDVTITTEKKTEITATVENRDGMQEVLNIVSDTVKKQGDDDGKVNVKLDLTDTTVSGEDLGKLAGIQTQITASDGTSWILPPENKPGDYKKETYTLTATVTRVDTVPAGITAEAAYQVNFADDIDFNATVGIQLGNPRELATLHQRNGSEFSVIQTVVVDGNGTAWFDLANTNSESDFYISINESGASPEEAKIPHTLYEEYGMTADGATLMDAQGRYYEVMAPKSSFGVDLKTFSMYVGVALVAVVLVVTIVMVLINQSKKTKARYAKRVPKHEKVHNKPAPQPEEQIDMDELRLKVMQDLLEEQKKKKGDS